MKLPVSWLFDPERGLLEGPRLPTEAICELFTFGAFPVEGVERVDGEDVIEIDVCANRPDAQCVAGLARNWSATSPRWNWKTPPPARGTPRA